MKVVEIRKLATADLIKQSVELREEITEMRRRLHSGEVQNVRALRNKKRDLARILTILTEQLAKEKI